MLLIALPLLLCQQPHHPHHETPRLLTDRESPVTLELTDEADSFSFAVFGDRTGGPPEGVKVLADAVRDVNIIGPDLVMTVGDLVQGYNQTPAWMVQAVEFKGIMDRLDMPWFPVAGNHDIYWRGGKRPAAEHEGNFEAFFGPLWYAFRHKNSWFYVLYSDEANPKTGERNFNKAECQTMSPEQFSWLKETLQQTKEAENVFVFLHHPRWLGGNYGDDWKRVHKELADVGNVKAVFAGHIHQMKYSGKTDGIEYFALATVGGANFGDMPEAGFLHQFDLVTVRKGEISVASFPVGTVDDVRAVTVEVSRECRRLADQMRPNLKGLLELDANMGCKSEVSISLTNPSSRPLDVTLSGLANDPRWYFVPDHHHFQLAAGETTEFKMQVRRWAEPLDRALRLPQLRMQADYLGEGVRVPLPVRTMPMPVSAQHLTPPPTPATEQVFAMRGAKQAAMMPARDLVLPDGPFTLEGWVNADRFADRQGFLCKTESSEYGIFLNKGMPEFSVYLDGRYVSAKTTRAWLKPKQWHHVAGVFDGQEVRVYVDGKLAAKASGSGKRKLNAFPLYIGADVNNRGQAVDGIYGQIDGVRLSTGARYSDDFSPQRRPEADANTLLLLHMDPMIGPWLFNFAPNAAHPFKLAQ
jgi:hypothetical protein